MTVDITEGSNYTAATGLSLGNYIVAKKAPVAADLDYTAPTGNVYNGSPQGLAVPGPRAPMTGLGTVTLHYDGIDGTTYDNDIPPTDAGNYRITAEIAVGANFTETTAPLTLCDYEIAKAPGADVSNAPTSAGVTWNSITVNEVTIPSNPGNQTVKYAISLDDDADPTTLDWQSEVLFPLLASDTEYYIYARTQETANYNAGTAQIGAIRTDLSVTGVTVAPATVEVQKGFTRAFTATVQGGLGIPQTVVWTVTDEAGNALGSGTTIDASGLLTVDAEESLSVLYVIATSTIDGQTSGRAVASLYMKSPLPGWDTEVTTPPGGDPVPDEDGGMTLPDGGEFTDPEDGSEYDLPPGTVIDEDGNITTGDGDGTIVTDDGDRIDIPGDTQITPDGDGEGHTVVEPGPDGATVTDSDGSETEVPGDGSIIIIDPSAPGGLRIECPVRFVLAPGVDADPAGEVNYVPMGRNFDFTLTPPSRDLAFTVTTGRIINGIPEKLLGHLNVDGTYTYTVREVRQAVVVTVSTYLNVGNETIASAHRVWTEGNRLFVDAAKPTTVSIYTVTGKRYDVRKVPAGQTSFVLGAPGVYVIEIAGAISKLRIRN